jgi:hypothetical protein
LPRRSGEAHAGGAIQARAEYSIKMPAQLANATAVSVLARDRLIVTSQAFNLVATFEVAAVLFQGSGFTFEVIARVPN